MARKKQPLKVIPEKEMFLFLINMEIIEKLKHLNGLQPIPSLKSELLHMYFLLPFFGVLAEHLFSLSLSLSLHIYIYIIVTTKKSPLSILRHLRVVNSEFLKNVSTAVFFKFHFFCTIFSHYLQSIISKFIPITLYNFCSTLYNFCSIYTHI